MYTIRYFENKLDLSSPEFPTIDSLVDYINQNPQHDYSVVFYKQFLVGYNTDDIILNKKPRRRFVNYMTKMIPVLDNYVSPWKTVEK